MRFKTYILFFLFGLFLIPHINYAQVDFNKTPDDDLGNVEDEFQEHFFEALKQKGIENYDRAIQSLQACINLNSSEPAVYFELGKNYKELKNFGAAEDALKKAINFTPDNEWYLDELYDVYAQQNDFDNAIKTVKQLVRYHPDYNEDLATLYVKTKKYKEALKILDEIDQTQGFTPSRDVLRNQIYAATGRKRDQIKNLKGRVAENPDEESNYLALIFRYSENNQKEKAFDTAKKLLEINPDSELVHLALYKFYLDDGVANKAIESMKTVLKSTQIKASAKTKVLSDFVKFVGANQQYEEDLVEVTTMISGDNNGKSFIDLAQYYLLKDNKEKAVIYYKKALEIEGQNYNLTRNILLLQIDLRQYKDAQKLSEEALLSYPSQPLLYLVNGVALKNLNRANEAVEILESGLDYIIDDTKMESDFYKQLSKSYELLNNTTKAKTFSDKAKQLEISN